MECTVLYFPWTRIALPFYSLKLTPPETPGIPSAKLNTWLILSSVCSVLLRLLHLVFLLFENTSNYLLTLGFSTSGMRLFVRQTFAWHSISMEESTKVWSVPRNSSLIYDVKFCMKYKCTAQDVLHSCSFPWDIAFSSCFIIIFENHQQKWENLVSPTI